MAEQNPRPVVVAVGYDPPVSALAYGIAEAERLGCGLHLVHVVDNAPYGPEMVLVDVTDVERIGRETLAAALESARSLGGDGVPVTGQLAHGAPVPAIIAAVPDARLIVLQRRVLSRIVRVVTRSMTNGVAARAHVPVVSVRAGWSPVDGDEGRVVTVGVEEPERSIPILEAAVAAARSRGAALHVLHTWSYPTAYDDVLLQEDHEWADQARLQVRAALDLVGTDGIKVVIEARHARAADALVEASRASDLVVVGRHDPLIPLGSHLGPVSRAVLHEAECPVLLTDPRPRHEVSA